MDRLQKKCFIASAGFHLLLAAILLVGPAFLSSSSKSDSTPILDVIPGKVIDAAFNGGGNPNAKPPPPLPPENKPQPPAPQPLPQPPPQPQPEVRATPEPAPETARETRTELPERKDPDSLETAKEKTRRLPNISLKEVSRPHAKKPATDSAVAEAAEARRYAEQRRRAAAAVGSLAQSLKEDMSDAVSIDTNYGPRGGGEAYASYDEVVRSIYWHAWVAPDDTATDDAIVKATVTIARDGNVLAARILRSSGDAGVDRSVQRTLERVTFVHAFPEGAKDKERTYTINFNLKAKRLSG